MKISPSTIVLSLLIAFLVTVTFYLNTHKEETQIYPVEYNKTVNQYRIEIPVIIYKKEFTVYSTGYVYFDNLDSVKAYRTAMLARIMGDNLNYSESEINKIENSWEEVELNGF